MSSVTVSLDSTGFYRLLDDCERTPDIYNRPPDSLLEEDDRRLWHVYVTIWPVTSADSPPDEATKTHFLEQVQALTIRGLIHPKHLVIDSSQIQFPYLKQNLYAMAYPRDFVNFWHFAKETKSLIIDLTQHTPTYTQQFSHQILSVCPFKTTDDALSQIYVSGIEGSLNTIYRIHYRGWRDGTALPLPELEGLCTQIESIPHDSRMIHCLAGFGRTGMLSVFLAVREYIHYGLINASNFVHQLALLVLGFRSARSGEAIKKVQLASLYDYTKELVYRPKPSIPRIAHSTPANADEAWTIYENILQQPKESLSTKLEIRNVAPSFSKQLIYAPNLPTIEGLWPHYLQNPGTLLSFTYSNQKIIWKNNVMLTKPQERQVLIQNSKTTHTYALFDLSPTESGQDRPFTASQLTQILGSRGPLWLFANQELAKATTLIAALLMKERKDLTRENVYGELLVVLLHLRQHGLELDSRERFTRLLLTCLPNNDER